MMVDWENTFQGQQQKGCGIIFNMEQNPRSQANCKEEEEGLETEV